VVARRVGPEIQIAVEDEGPGIPGENLERIFERFYTDRPESEGFGQNSGLGLSISRQIAEAHGGSLRAENIIDAESAEILGARFILALPAAANS
jgi:two-component system sensor histidine kinase ChvG